MKKIILYLIFATCLIISSHNSYAQTEPHPASLEIPRPLDSALVQICKLEPREFMSKSKGDFTKNNFGFQVEEFEKIFPSLVTTSLQVEKTRNFGKIYSRKTVVTKEIDYATLIPVLVAAMQEQQAIILRQQQQIDALQKLIPTKPF